jgi:hypothetical protein
MAKNEVTRVLNKGGRKGDKLPIPYNGCQFFWMGQGHREPVSSHLNKSLIELIQSEKTKKYWAKKKRIGPEMSTKVDWEILKKCNNLQSMEMVIQMCHQHLWSRDDTSDLETSNT